MCFCEGIYLLGYNMSKVILTGDSLTIQDIINVVDNGFVVEIGLHAKHAIYDSRKRVEKLVDANIPAYGINTGFGVNSSISIPQDKTIRLQENIIKSHSCGVGKCHDDRTVRAAMLLRANCLVKGYSGVRVELIEKLLELVNKGLTPVVPLIGSLGSSGDLAPLSHTFLPLYGQGSATYKGQVLSGKEAMKQADISLLPLSHKEGLALTNGFVYGAAQGALAIYELENIVNKLEIIVAMLIEGLSGITLAFKSEIHEARPHKGVQHFAKSLLKMLQESTLVDTHGEFNVHSAYSIRCAPQIFGCLRETLRQTKDVIKTEINSAIDNPLLFEDESGNPYSLSAGHFHGQPVGLAVAHLNITLVASLFKGLNGLVTRIVDSKLNNGLPGFLVEDTGLESGFMIPQYTLASIYSKAQNLAIPHLLGNAPACAMTEDVNAMASEDVKNLYQLVDLAYDALAIALLTATQALYFRLQGHTRRIYELDKKHLTGLKNAAPAKFASLKKQYEAEISKAKDQPARLGEGTGPLYRKTISVLKRKGLIIPYTDSAKPMFEWVAVVKQIVRERV